MEWTVTSNVKQWTERKRQQQQLMDSRESSTNEWYAWSKIKLALSLEGQSVLLHCSLLSYILLGLSTLRKSIHFFQIMPVNDK